MNVLVLSALAEPNRLRMVEFLRDKPASVGEIAKRLSLRQPQASKHLRILSDSGLVQVRAEAQKRIYQLSPKPFEALDNWLETFRQLWEGRLDRMDTLLHELKKDRKRNEKK